MQVSRGVDAYCVAGLAAELILYGQALREAYLNGTEFDVQVLECGKIARLQGNRKHRSIVKGYPVNAFNGFRKFVRFDGNAAFKLLVSGNGFDGGIDILYFQVFKCHGKLEFQAAYRI